jgi:hypothetical protein
MACYSQLLGHKVTVEYRVGDILLPASATLVADSGRSIFLEQHLEQRGKRSYFRWEIPYRCIHRLEEERVPGLQGSAEPVPASAHPAHLTAAAGAGLASSSAPPSILPVSQRSKTA